jgi:transcriptional regulator with XRE-family HTH domain
MSAARRPPLRSAYHAVLGVHLRRLRVEKGVRTSLLVEGFDVSTALISKVERGQRGMSAQSLGVYCDALGVDLLETLSEVAVRYRQEHDPFDVLASAAVPYFVRQLDGLALFAQIPERFLPAGLVRPVGDGCDGR